MGYLLNADVNILANFTNPNRKVGVDFSYVGIALYYQDTLIATQAVQPFAATRAESRFANVHLVTSQVRLSLADRIRLSGQIENNRVELKVKGFFRARSSLGPVLRYSYWLYGRCTIILTAPPSGVLVSSTCRTKR